MIILLIVLFSGETFLPEFEGSEDSNSDFTNKLNYKYSNAYKFSESQYTCPNYTEYCNLMNSGRDYFIDGSKDYLIFYNDSYIPSRHVIKLKYYL